VIGKGFHADSDCQGDVLFGIVQRGAVEIKDAFPMSSQRPQSNAKGNVRKHSGNPR
jgi:hypothetical protein